MDRKNTGDVSQKENPWALGDHSFWEHVSELTNSFFWVSVLDPQPFLPFVAS